MGSDRRVRLGALGLPLSGALSTVSALIPGVWINPATDPNGFAQASAGVGLGNMIGIISAVFLVVGVQSLFWALTRTSSDSWALIGWLSTLVGMLLFLPFAGIFAFTAPVVGTHFLRGESNAVNIIPESTGISNLSALIFGGTAVFLIFLAGIAIAIAAWKSGTLPKWSGIIYAVGSTLVVDPLYIYQPAVSLTGSVLLLISGSWIAMTLFMRNRQPGRS